MKSIAFGLFVFTFLGSRLIAAPVYQIDRLEVGDWYSVEERPFLYIAGLNNNGVVVWNEHYSHGPTWTQGLGWPQLTGLGQLSVSSEGINDEYAFYANFVTEYPIIMNIETRQVYDTKNENLEILNSDWPFIYGTERAPDFVPLSNVLSELPGQEAIEEQLGYKIDYINGSIFTNTKGQLAFAAGERRSVFNNGQDGYIFRTEVLLLTPIPVPEPATLAMFAISMGAVGFTKRRRGSKK